MICVANAAWFANLEYQIQNTTFTVSSSIRTFHLLPPRPAPNAVSLPTSTMWQRGIDILPARYGSRLEPTGSNPISLANFSSPGRLRSLGGQIAHHLLTLLMRWCVELRQPLRISSSFRCHFQDVTCYVDGLQILDTLVAVLNLPVCFSW